MKKRLQTLLAFLPFLLSSFLPLKAQNPAYEKAMKKEIAALLQADSVSQLQESANAFARISTLNQSEWQPMYYNALAYTFQGLNKNLTLDKKDAALSLAEELAKKANALSPSNAEIVALQGFVVMAKLSADPASRGQSLSGVAMQTFGKALAIDKQNPRALILLAQMERGMAQFFGSGTEKACGLAKQSLAIFSEQNEEARKAAILPTWGKNMAEGMVKSCQ